MASLLLNSEAELVQQLLIVLGLGTTPPTNTVANNSAWPVFASNEPAEPDNIITVIDTPNQTFARLMPTGKYAHQYGFRVRVRAVDHPTGYQKIKQIALQLAHNVGGDAGPINVVCTGNNYLIHAIAKIGGVMALGKDAPKSKRSVFTVDGYVVL